MLKNNDARRSLAESMAFRSLNALERQQLYQFCQIKKVKINEILIKSNQPHPFVYFLWKGCLKKSDVSFDKMLLPLSFVGLEGLFTKQKQSEEIRATMDSLVIKISYALIEQLMRSNGKLSWDLGVILQQSYAHQKRAQIISILPGQKLSQTAGLALQLALSMRSQFKKEVLLIDLNSDLKTIQEILAESKNYQYVVLHLPQVKNTPACKTLRDTALQYSAVLVAAKLPQLFKQRFFKLQPFYQTPLGVTRLARQIAHKTIGVALSSGMASSLYHVGVIKALKQAGMPIDAIAGCSGGALVGSLFSNGKKFNEIDTFIKHMIHKPFYQHLNLNLNKAHLVSFNPILKSLKKFLGDKKLSQTDTPLQIVTTDLKTKKKYVFKKGDMYQAVGASFAMPFLSSVYTLHNKKLVDGYLTEPVPTPTLKEAGIDYVLAVDVTDDGTPGEIKHFMDLYFHTRRTLTSNLRQAALQQSDLLIQPQFKKYKPLDYSMYPEYLKMGERAAKKIIPQIRKYLTA